MKPSDLVSIGVGIATGNAVTDELDEDSPIGAIAAGFVAGSIGTSVTSKVLKDTGVGDLIDDIFDW